MAKGKSRAGTGRLGGRLAKDFRALRDVLRSGQPVEKKFTVKTVRLDLTPRQFDHEAVVMLRHKLGVSQAVFAQIVAVSTQQVSAWEQGRKPVGKMAARLFELIESNPGYWLRLLEQRPLRSKA